MHVWLNWMFGFKHARTQMHICVHIFLSDSDLSVSFHNVTLFPVKKLTPIHRHTSAQAHTNTHKHTLLYCCSYYKISQLDIIAMQIWGACLHKCNLICFIFRLTLGSLWEHWKRERVEGDGWGGMLTEQTTNATNGISISFNLLESLRSALCCNMPLPWLTRSVSFMLQTLFTSVIPCIQDNP